MLVTAWCIVVVLGGLLVVGIPAAWLLNGRRPLAGADHVRAPFLGLAVITLVLQNLVYLDVPLRQSTPFLWAGVLALWFWLYRSGHLGASLRQCPRTVLAAALLVYLVQGIGLLCAGAASYAGRCWADQFNYTSLAQFLVDEPLGTPPEDLGERPYLVAALVLKGDRIGQSIVHGFFTRSSGLDARTLFEPTILLSPDLLVLATWALGRRLRLRRGRALAAATVAGLLPAVTLIHLESFLSQALALPLLVLWPVLLDELAARPDGRRLATCALVLTAATSIYTELWPVFLGVSVLVLVPALWANPRRGRLLACLGTLAASPLLLNPGLVASVRAILGRLDDPGLKHVYPWAFTEEGLGRLWLGDLAAHLAGPLSWVVALVAWGATLLGGAGLLQFLLRRLTGAGPGRVGLALGLVGVALLPVVVRLKDEDHPYQYYKLLLTVSPLLLVGLARFGGRARPTAPMPAHLAGRVRGWLALGVLPLGAVFPLVLAGTAAMVWESGRLPARPPSLARFLNPERTLAHFLRDPDVRQLARLLEKLHQGKLLIACSNVTFLGMSNSWFNGWLAWFARHNRVWLAEPMTNGFSPDAVPGSARFLAPMRYPDRLLVLVNRTHSFRLPPVGDTSLLWANPSYELWQTNSRRWALPLVNNANLVQEFDGRSFLWVGASGTTVEVLAGSPGRLTVQAWFTPGCPCPPATSQRRVRITTSRGYRAELVTRGGLGSFTVPVASGRTTVTLAVTWPAPPSGDGRLAMLSACALSARFLPGPQQDTRSVSRRPWARRVASRNKE
jgi:hypothetical protein